MKVIKGWLKGLLVSLAFIIIIWMFYQTGLFQILISGDLDKMYAIVNDQLPFLLMMSFVIILIQNALTVIPLLLVLTKNIALFGFVYGLILSWFFSIIAAAIVFVCIRYLFKDFFAGKISEKTKVKIEENGFMYVLAARVLLVLPTSIINLVAAVSSIKFKDFILATSIGNLIYFSVLSLIPLGFLKGSFDLYFILIGIAIAVVVYIFYRKHKKKKAALICL